MVAVAAKSGGDGGVRPGGRCGNHQPIAINGDDDESVSQALAALDRDAERLGEEMAALLSSPSREAAAEPWADSSGANGVPRQSSSITSSQLEPDVKMVGGIAQRLVAATEKACHLTESKSQQVRQLDREQTRLARLVGVFQTARQIDEWFRQLEREVRTGGQLANIVEGVHAIGEALAQSGDAAALIMGSLEMRWLAQSDELSSSSNGGGGGGGAAASIKDNGATGRQSPFAFNERLDRYRRIVLDRLDARLAASMLASPATGGNNNGDGGDGDGRRLAEESTVQSIDDLLQLYSLIGARQVGMLRYAQHLRRTCQVALPDRLRAGSGRAGAPAPERLATSVTIVFEYIAAVLQWSLDRFVAVPSGRHHRGAPADSANGCRRVLVDCLLEEVEAQVGSLIGTYRQAPAYCRLVEDASRHRHQPGRPTSPTTITAATTTTTKDHGSAAPPWDLKQVDQVINEVAMACRQIYSFLLHLGSIEQAAGPAVEGPLAGLPQVKAELRRLLADLLVLEPFYVRLGMAKAIQLDMPPPLPLPINGGGGSGVGGGRGDDHRSSHLGGGGSGNDPDDDGAEADWVAEYDDRAEAVISSSVDDVFFLVKKSLGRLISVLEADVIGEAVGRVGELLQVDYLATIVKRMKGLGPGALETPESRFKYTVGTNDLAAARRYLDRLLEEVAGELDAAAASLYRLDGGVERRQVSPAGGGGDGDGEEPVEYRLRDHLRAAFGRYGQLADQLEGQAASAMEYLYGQLVRPKLLPLLLPARLLFAAGGGGGGAGRGGGPPGVEGAASGGTGTTLDRAGLGGEGAGMGAGAVEDGWIGRWGGEYERLLAPYGAVMRRENLATLNRLAATEVATTWERLVGQQAAGSGRLTMAEAWQFDRRVRQLLHFFAHPRRLGLRSRETFSRMLQIASVLVAERRSDWSAAPSDDDDDRSELDRRNDEEEEEEGEDKEGGKRAARTIAAGRQPGLTRREIEMLLSLRMDLLE